MYHKMIRITLMLQIMFLVPSLANAGEIYGNIKQKGGAPVQKATVEIMVNQKTVGSTTTDKHGSYRIYVKETGRCTLKIRFDDQFPTVEVYSSKSSTQYNLILEKKDEGSYSLRRK